VCIGKDKQLFSASIFVTFYCTRTVKMQILHYGCRLQYSHAGNWFGTCTSTNVFTGNAITTLRRSRIILVH
jgi:hypothetical protein